MQKVKGLENPPSGVHWSYGSECMQRISKGSAKKLCFPLDLPSMGYQVVVGRSRDYRGYLHFLYVQNISGDFYIACCSAEIIEWPELFGVEIT